jgi:hypothetical protein
MNLVGKTKNQKSFKYNEGQRNNQTMKNNLKSKDLKMFSIIDAFRDRIISEPMVSLGNSFELLVLVSRIG